MIFKKDDQYSWKGGTATIVNSMDNLVYFTVGANQNRIASRSEFLKGATKIEPKTIPKKTLKISSAGDHQDILQLPKEKSKNFYSIIGIIIVIIIAFEAKIFKKLIK